MNLSTNENPGYISLELLVALQLKDPLVEVGRVHLVHGAHADTALVLAD